MPLSSCTPCTCISPLIGNDKFKQDIEIILCDILTVLDAQGKAAIPRELVQIAYTSVAASFTQVLTGYTCTWYKIINRTTSDLIFSINGLSSHFLVEANSEETYGDVLLGALVGATGLWYKSATPQLPDSGYFIVQGII